MSGSALKPMPAGECGPPAPWWIVAVMIIGAAACVVLQACNHIRKEMRCPTNNHS